MAYLSNSYGKAKKRNHERVDDDHNDSTGAEGPAAVGKDRFLRQESVGDGGASDRTVLGAVFARGRDRETEFTSIGRIAVDSGES